MGPRGCFLYSLLKGDNFIPIILFLTEFPNESLPSTKLGLTNREIFWSFLRTTNSIVSEVDIFMKVETSKILSTFLLSIYMILSFFYMQATKAGLSFWTSSTSAGVISLPTNMLIIVKISIAKKKLANGPAATIKDL